ncbi:trigger factor, ppiase [Renibacterium salmoninarum ATCC 33209]|uniref:Trigger factor n=1 Tax=Renibacterium salmoninarum (strain ATCC 33209 / DSM 20767 / JCM 11484 / NBRC 15589 / NCIMB 2235) TaxID=288705 RepID=TIG_RENSM|nr:trigger factor [Renibacterium salmoninarum]A9WUW4.1 RecName: Full=Trigger factor; Short=TF; AltName: Full=PPIase [Renibacterium salmoninarum ATCC 33209]ABY24985.1 trigger factor, ppiase [Renibacterium salmoninarum ATCC 33209]
MKSAVENLSPTRVKLDVEVPFEELQPSIAEAYKTIAEQVQIPGFRKGKFPNRLIDQRVGRGYVLETAINEGLNGWYQNAVAETGLRPLSRPEVEITEVPDPAATDGELKFKVEVDVRPEVELPDYAGITVEVAPAEQSDEDRQKALDDLRGRFGTLKPADRPAAKDDFITIDINAKIADEDVDSATGLSYQVGAGTMLEGLDEAVEGLSTDEEAIFDTKLVGGEHAGEAAQVTVKLTAVKVRELPEADDDFAQLASEFDTIAELREDLVKQVNQSKTVEQGVEARDKVMEKLVELIEVPIPESVIEEQLEQHFDPANAHGEEDHDTEEHRVEVRENTERAFKNEIILDAVADKEEISVSQAELIDYIVNSASQYGMDPNQFAQMLDQSGQVPMVVSEVRRRKALAHVLGLATVTDTEGAAVDLSDFVKPAVDPELEAALNEAAGVTGEDDDTEAEEERVTVSADDPGAARF